MTVRAYLKRIYYLDLDIRKETKKVELLRETLDGYQKSLLEGKNGQKLPSKRRAPYEKIVEKIDAYERSLCDKIGRLWELRREMDHVFDQVEDDRERALLQYRYLMLMSWGKVAEEMEISIRTVYRIHTRALENFQVPEGAEEGFRLDISESTTGKQTDIV